MARKGSCPACEVSYINHVRCHEHGCPEAWKDYKRECKWCGRLFTPEERGQSFCDESCAESYSNPLGRPRFKNPKYLVSRSLPPYGMGGEYTTAFKSRGDWRIDRERLSPDVMADYAYVEALDRTSAIRKWKETHKGKYRNPRKAKAGVGLFTLLLLGGAGYMLYRIIKGQAHAD